VVVVPNGLTAMPPASDVGLQPPTAVVVANFIGYKGHSVLVDALALCRAELRVRLVGTGPALGEVLQRAAAAGVAGRISVAPPPADVGAELASAQFAVHPSLTEGLSNAILEELSAGLAVVATDVGGVRSQVTDGVNGLIVPPGDAAALARSIDRLALAPDERVRLGANARAAASDFTWDSCSAAHLALYDRLVRARAALGFSERVGG
jgi:glycosyltransferase involved in cell wall biosynthesis